MSADLVRRCVEAHSRRDLTASPPLSSRDLEQDWTGSRWLDAGCTAPSTQSCALRRMDTFEEVIIEQDCFVIAGHSAVAPNAARLSCRDGI